MPRTLLLITDLEIGGTPTVVRELALRLSRRGHEIEVACLSKWGPVADQIAAGGVKVTALDAKGPRDLVVFQRLVRLIHQRGITTVFSFLIHANTAAAVARLLCPGVRFIQSIQTTQPEPRWHWSLQRIVHHAASRLVVPSASVARHAIDRCDIPADKITVIPNAVNPDEFSPSPIPAQNPRPYPIGFIGRLDPVKRLPEFIASFAALARDNTPVHLQVFGDGPDRPRVEEAVRKHELEPHVTLHGAVARPQDALQRIGLLVLPSQAEGFGLVLIEAMASSVPVVATNVPGIRDVVRDGYNGLLVPLQSQDGMRHALLRVVEDPSLRARLIRNGLATVRERFSFDQILPQYERLLREQTR